MTHAFTRFTRDIVDEDNHRVIPTDNTSSGESKTILKLIEQIAKLQKELADLRKAEKMKSMTPFEKTAEKVNKILDGDDTMGRLDRAIAALERTSSIPDAPNAGPTVEQLFRGYQQPAVRQAQICAEAEAAYAARNPHK